MQNAAETVRGFLNTVVGRTGFQLQFVVTGELIPEEVGLPAQTLREPAIRVEFTGPDLALVTARNGELLHALEHLTAKVLQLEPEQHDRISFDADHFKANRDRDLRLSATRAVETVRRSGKAFSFPPMTSRERRLLHLALSESGLPTASSGDGPRRFVVLYPETHQASAESFADVAFPLPAAAGPDRTEAVRSSFRRR